MGVKLQAASGGSVELVPTNTASSFTVTVPAATMTVVGTDTTQTLTNKTLTTPNIDSAQVATVSGTAPLYMCRAWVNFNGTGTVAIRASGNVSSITDNGTGDYTVNFTTALSDANYQVSMSSVSYTNGNFSLLTYIKAGASNTVPALKTTTQLGVVYASSASATYFDCSEMNVSIFR
jgi:hypothetical protein